MGVWRSDNYYLEPYPTLFRNTLKLGSTGMAFADSFAGMPTAGKENGDVFFLPSLSNYSVLLSLAGVLSVKTATKSMLPECSLQLRKKS